MGRISSDGARTDPSLVGVLRGRVGLVLATALSTVLLASSLSPAVAQEVTVLTFEGPTRVRLGVQTTYSGKLTLGGVGVPLKTVEITDAGAPIATAQTAQDGTYSVPVTLLTYGFHELRAVVDRGTPLEVKSSPLSVEALPDEDTSVADDLHDTSGFIYSGPAAVQTGVAPGTIKPARVAVLRGAVTTPAGAQLSGVTVTVPGHAEFGEGAAGSDGVFDMAVNGGQRLVVRLERDGYLPVERSLDVPWRDYAVLDDIVMTPLDSAVTTIQTASSNMQVARANSVTDGNGTRRATLMFPSGTQASMTLPDGSKQTLSTLNVRASEFTVGNRGPEAMPATLPPASGYTYAVELSVDEAMAADATKVTFNQPVPFYVENFLDFATGARAPVGYYDRALHAWVGSKDGRVLKIVSETSGLADLDTDGDGLADSGANLTALGITDPEREQVATFYAPGQSLWRVAVDHFTPWDINWPFGLPAGARGPGQDEGEPGDEDSQCTQDGSIIGCEGQTLGEVVPLAGTPYHLRYDSSRASGRAATRSLRIPLSGSTLPPGLKRITLDVTVAGRSFHQEFDPPSANLTHLFNWDGKDAYGRVVQGREPAQVSIGYVYNGVYWNAGGTIDGASWGATGTSPTLNPARQEITLYQRYTSMLGAVLDSGARHLGGWSVSAHHVYDPDDRALYRGDGTTVRADAFMPAFKAFAGNGDAGSGGGTYSGDGGPARLAGLARVKGLTVGPDPSVYIADWGNALVRRVGPDGIITRFAGGGTPASGNGDGGPATGAELGAPADIAFGPDGSLFISDMGDGRVRRVAPDGTISTVAGGGAPADGLGDGLPATQADLEFPRGIAVAQDGTVYVTDTGHDRVRAIRPDGVITTLVGGGTPADGIGDGKRGPEAALLTPLDVAVGPDGSVYVADADHDRVRRVDPSGEVSTFAGTGGAGYSGDGGPATAAALSFPASVAVDGSNGRVYVAQRLHHVVRQIDSEGIITTIAGTGTAGYSGTDGPPAAARMNDPQALAVGHDHEVLVADTDNFRVRMIDLAMPGFATTDIIVPSSDGGELYHSDKNGRHLRTLDALTGVANLRFSYDTDGRLVSIKDPYDNTTTIERNSAGLPTAIVSPFGRSTQLNIGSDGYLESITNPNNETTIFDYDAGGLLVSETQPGGRVHVFNYNPQGRLIADDGPGAGATTLDRTEIPRGHRVSVTSPGGKTTTYEVENLASGAVRRTITRPWGGVTRSVAQLDGSIELTSEDGTKVTSTMGPDPRFGLMTPIPTAMTTTTPAARQIAMSFARSVTLSDPNDPLSLTGQTDTVTSNNKTVTRAYNRATQTMTTTSTEGRQGTVTLNDKGRVVNVAAGGLAPVSFNYDLRGRVASVTRGSGASARTTTMTYDPQGFLDTVTNPLSETTSFDYDGVGRVKKQVLADTKQIAFDYDGVGNLASMTPPERSAHGFTHDTRDLLDRYTPPGLPVGATDTTYAHTNDKQVDSMTLPTGEVVDHQYDASGRLDAIGFSRGLIDYAYTGSTIKLASIAAPGGIGLSYSFDGPLLTGLTATGDAAASVGYGYDADLRVNSRTLNGGNATSYAYDKDGLLTAAGALSLSWGAANGLLSATSLGSVATSHGYNGFGEPESTTATYTDPVTSVTTPRYSVSYTRDALGRIATKNETVGGTTTVWGYAYDNRGRLKTVKKDGAAHASYAYDANGNREAVTEGGSTGSATFDAQDRLTSQGSTTYEYTKDGHLSSKTASGTTTTYDYDELGSLMEVSSPTKTVTYRVDGLGRRVVKKVDGVATNRFLYGQGLQPVAELDATGSGIKSQFVYASQTHVPDFMTRGGVAYRFVTDQVGSVRLVVNTADGTVAQRIDYDAFGKVLADTNPGFQPFGFAGGLYDPDTGLVRFGARDYDAETGRWTAKDPIRFRGGDTNLYAYAGSDPVNFIDPSGLFLGGVFDFVSRKLCELGNFVIDIADEVALVASVVAVVAISVTGAGAIVAAALVVSSIASGLSAAGTCRDSGVMSAECGVALAGAALSIGAGPIGRGAVSAIHKAGLKTTEKAGEVLTTHVSLFSNLLGGEE